MAISTQQRRVAEEIGLESARMEQLGIYAATVIGRRAQRSSVATYRRGQDPRRTAAAAIAAIAPLLVDAMIAGYLMGVWRLYLLAKLREQSATISFTTSPYRQQLRFLVRRVSLPWHKLDTLGKRYGLVANKVTTNIGQALNRKLGAAIAESKRRGEHVREGIKRLEQAFEDAGVTALRSHQLEAVFRTQTMLANSAGAWAADQNPAIQEILWGYQYVSVGDTRVRPNHAAMDGITLPKDDPFWDKNTPPNGWNCRCQALPLFESEKIVKPPTDFKDIDGNVVKPLADEGFQFHPGKAFKSVVGVPGKVPAGKLPLPKIELPSPSRPVTKPRTARSRIKSKKILKTGTPKVSKLSNVKQAVIKPIKRATPTKVAVMEPPVVTKRLPRGIGEKIPKPLRIGKPKATIKSVKVVKTKKRKRVQQKAIIVIKSS